MRCVAAGCQGVSREVQTPGMCMVWSACAQQSRRAWAGRFQLINAHCCRELDSWAVQGLAVVCLLPASADCSSICHPGVMPCLPVSTACVCGPTGKVMLCTPRCKNFVAS